MTSIGSLRDTSIETINQRAKSMDETVAKRKSTHKVHNAYRSVHLSDLISRLLGHLLAKLSYVHDLTKLVQVEYISFARLVHVRHARVHAILAFFAWHDLARLPFARYRHPTEWTRNIDMNDCYITMYA